MVDLVKLGDVCTVVSGSTPKTSVDEYWNGNVKWITPAELDGDSYYVYDTVKHISELGRTKTGLSYMPEGTVILSSRAPIGKTAIAGSEMCCNQGFKNLICSDRILNKYLFFFLRSKTEFLNSLGRGATFKELSKSIVENVEIPLPPIEEQTKISEKFICIDNQLHLRKQQLKNLDELVKSRFIEMFGDYRINDKGFVRKKGSELFKFSSGKFLAEEKRFASGIPVYGGNGIAWYTDKSLVDFPTVIIGRVGAQCGNIHAVTTPAWITDNAIYIKEQKTTVYTLEFLTELMRMMEFYQYADFSGQPKITQKPLETLEYIIPPIELQNEYTTFVEQTDKLKLEIKESLEKLETLKKSLMQEYFG